MTSRCFPQSRLHREHQPLRQLVELLAPCSSARGSCGAVPDSQVLCPDHAPELAKRETVGSLVSALGARINQNELRETRGDSVRNLLAGYGVKFLISFA